MDLNTSDAKVWERFLSDADSAYLAAGWQKTEPYGLGTTPALIVIDNTETVFGERPSGERSSQRPNAAQFGAEAWERIDATAEVLSVARACSVPVIYTVIGQPNPWGPFRIEQYRATLDDPKFSTILPEIAPQSGELIISKAGASSFMGTSLMAHLTSLRIDTLLVCGNSTSGCVRATSVDASCYGFFVGVIEDCTIDRIEASHAMSLFDLDQKYCDVIEAADAKSYMEGLARS